MKSSLAKLIFSCVGVATSTSVPREAVAADDTCAPGDAACAFNAVQVAMQKGSKVENSEESTWPRQKLISGDAIHPTKTMKPQSDPDASGKKALFPGIWWMDQYGTSVEGDFPEPDYPYFFPAAAPEVLFTTAEARWVEGADGPKPGVSPCLWPNAGGGVTPENTWAYINTNGLGWNFYWPTLNPPPAGWFAGEGKNLPPPPFNGYGLYFCPFNDTVINVPLQGLEARFVKKSWGYDRVTRFTLFDLFGPFKNIVGYMGSIFMNLFVPAFRNTGFVNWAQEQHYPVYQIIDADGKETANFAKYKDFINKRRSCATVTFPPFSWYPSWWPSFLVPNLVGKRNLCNQGPGSFVYATNATWNSSSGGSKFFR